MHLASEGSAFRGNDELIENIGKSNQSGKFLNLINLISHYNEPLKEHLERHKKGGLTYFSHGIQNEFLKIISDKIKREIISKIKSTKYYSIIFDCTPDTSHEEQMSKMIRYVVANENGCEIVESFLGFIRVYKKTGETLSEDIINSIILQNYLSLNDCRGQSYDNGANMTGKSKGMQAKILSKNDLAVFIPCSAHCLNLIGVNATKSIFEIESFFGIIQKLFNFFSSSTQRWDILMDNLQLSLKGYSTTRWSSKQKAVRLVRALNLQLSKVIKVFGLLNEETLSAEAKFDAKNLLKAINTFSFICMLITWDKILSTIDRVNIILQSSKIMIDMAVAHLRSLIQFFEKFREDEIDGIFIDAEKKLKF
uniref:Zinc finger MYM-type protein 1 n=1 Tax=Schizaphis graminum TaxID=13262 RepID=A0A2S2PS81_SCHGA